MLNKSIGFILLVFLFWQPPTNGDYPLDYSRTEADENGNYNRTIYLSYDQQQIYILAQLNKRRQGDLKISIAAAPYQVILYEDNDFVCNGAIINSLWILTAGYCAQSPESQYSIRAGSRYLQQGGQLRRVVKIIINSRFNLRFTDNDLALMKLNEPLRMGRLVEKVGLPLTNAVPRKMLIAGWRTESINQDETQATLRAALVSYVKQSKCRAASYGFRTSEMLCATSTTGVDDCPGQLGSPLVYQGVIYGIVSSDNDCYNAQFPGVYTRVSQFTSWILRTVRRNR